MATVLVTGANGHLGANTVRSLLAYGHEVAPMVRRGSDLRGLDGLGLAYRYADVLDTDAVHAAMEGCEVVIHCAAVYAVWAKDPVDIVQPSVAGTRNIFAAAQATGVKRIVFTSSIAAVGYSDSPDELRTSDDWNVNAANPYYVAKVLGEREAIRLADETGIDTVRLCPSNIMGPWDYRVTPSMGQALDLINGKGVTYRGGVNLVHAIDAGEAHARAVDAGEAGGRYIVCGENLDMVQMGAEIENLTGVRPRHLGVGRSVSVALGALLETAAAVTGRQPQFSRSLAKEHSHRFAYFDCSPTNRDFDLTPQSAQMCLYDAIRWLLYLRRITHGLPAEVVDHLAPDAAWPAF